MSMRSLVLFLFCLPSPVPTDVTVTDVKGLVAAVAGIAPGKTILIAPGTYVLPQRLALTRGGTAAAPIVIAAASGPGTVVIDANGAEEAFFVSGACFLRIEGLTITGGACHAIMVSPPSTDVVILNNRMYDNTRTTQLNNQVSAVKGNPGAARVTVENNVVEQIATYGGDNFQGIDCNAGVDWIVRGNIVRDIRGAALSGSGIQFKSGSVGTIIENNFVFRCGLNGIVYGGFGNPAWGKQTFEHVGGVVRNNVVAGCADAGITAINTCDGKVVNNTLFNNGHPPDVRRPTQNLEYRNNILDRAILFRDGTSAAANGGNVVLNKPSDAGWFMNAEGLDFRLRPGAPVVPGIGATATRKSPRRPTGGRSPKEDVRLGREAMARGEWSKATRHFEAAADADDDDLAAQAREALGRIERAGLARLQEIQALEAIDEVADAITAYQDFAREFAGFPAAEEARRRLEALKKRRK
jgi:hypothetical protein